MAWICFPKGPGVFLFRCPAAARLSRLLGLNAIGKSVSTTEGRFVGTISNCAGYICRQGFNRAELAGVLPQGR